ncbi:invasion associated locus B family protein [Roseivivax halotolerans]|uniref:invasion associated locus B family protein n=1 Tax=Roseivivax halotolerans TaxID=93684 RepID=UPI00158718BD|nr:invasion associated locus B family protein [Roseivivax halotolerans]
MRISYLTTFFLLNVIAQPSLAQTGPDEVLKIGSWSLECFASEEQPQCQIYQRVEDADAGVVALAIAIAILGDGTVQTEIALPLGIRFSVPPELRVDEEVSVPLPVGTCVPEGCLVQGSLPSDILSAINDGETASVVMQSAAGDVINIPFSISSFSDAFDQLVERAGALPEDPSNEAGS